jgi:hypothetical protein
MSGRRKVGPAPTVDDISASLGARYEIAEASAPVRAAPAAGSVAKTRRSWLLPAEVAEAFAAAADRIHHGSGGRIGKSEAQAAIIQAGLAHEAEIAEQLNGTPRT